MHHHHRHFSPSELLKQIQEGIALQGFALRHVLASENMPAFSYTVGLHVPGSQKPELFLSGLSIPFCVHWLLDLGFRVQGPPPLATRQRMAREQHVPLETLVFPPEGQLFLPGVRYNDLAGNDLPLCFGEVERRFSDEFFGQAIAFHRTRDFPVLQIVWTDRQGRFPWDDGFEPRFEGKQRLLFDPQRYLPLHRC
jgi:hypothetical protein